MLSPEGRKKAAEQALKVLGGKSPEVAAAEVSAEMRRLFDIISGADELGGISLPAVCACLALMGFRLGDMGFLLKIDIGYNDALRHFLAEVQKQHGEVVQTGQMGESKFVLMERAIEKMLTKAKAAALAIQRGEDPDAE